MTIKLKGYKWSNGETVDAQDVVFWMNMLKADATSWAAYAPGPGQFPGNVVNVVGEQLDRHRHLHARRGLQPRTGSPTTS